MYYELETPKLIVRSYPSQSNNFFNLRFLFLVEYFFTHLLFIIVNHREDGLEVLRVLEYGI